MHPRVADTSWTEGELVVAVAAAPTGLGIVVRKQVRGRAGGTRAHQTNAGAAGEGHGQVVTVDHRDVVEILGAADAELGQRRGRLPGDGAIEGASAVTGIAVAAASTTAEGAACAAPEPAGCAGGHGDGPRLSWVQPLASAGRDDCWPHRVVTVVFDGEGGRAGIGGQGSE